MNQHTFAICAYQDSPYLEACIKSLKRQAVPADIILCTSTPSSYIDRLAGKYQIPVYVRDGASGILDDWNFACHMADTPLVTVAHQDDVYHKDYGKTLLEQFKKYPDMTLFTSDYVNVKHGKIKQYDVELLIKRILRLPLRCSKLNHLRWVKRSALMFGNPIGCPTCTYNKAAIGEPVFDSPFQFALDWDTTLKLADRPGRFICVEKPLLYYRIHDGATTKECIRNQSRIREETEMYRKFWPEPLVRLLIHYYKKAYAFYD